MVRIDLGNKEKECFGRAQSPGKGPELGVLEELEVLCGCSTVWQTSRERKAHSRGLGNGRTAT